MNNNNISIVPGSIPFVHQIVDLQASIVKDHYLKVYSAPEYAHLPIGQNTLEIFNESLKTFDQELLKKINQQQIYVALLNEKIVVGYITFNCDKLFTLMIDLLMVHAQYRGYGIGQKLIEYTIYQLKQKQGKILLSCILYTLRYNNEATQKFYEHCGFIQEGIGSCELHPIPNEDIYLSYKCRIPIN